ncbi:hypothetical protein HID58_056209 [Brassica napus]|uniref:Uncharacterized protein n=1 Tax=Brassica napus TaxID=3708 RepID=A0ABQ8AMQ3_BRANA|nr:hypothetical protein HID58_056209 [Brassica napus]
MVREMLSHHPFYKGDCIPTIIAERVSTEMNGGAVASYVEVDEDGRNMGSKVRLFSVQRPKLSNEDDDDDEGTS